MTDQSILKVAVGIPLRQIFDYLLPPDISADRLQEGARVNVPFGRQQRVGVIIEIVDRSDLDEGKLKACTELLDNTPIFDSQQIKLLKWASAYYHHPVGEVFAAAMPAELRKGGSASPPQVEMWRVSSTVEISTTSASLSRAKRQRAFFDWLATQTEGASRSDCQLFSTNWRDAARKLEEKHLIEMFLTDRPTEPFNDQASREQQHALNDQQQQALDAISAGLHAFQVTLLDGVTGSGKTEVYFRAMQKVLDADQQVLVLIPEIALTMQLIERFRKRFHCPIALIHSGLSDSERLRSWHDARSGEARVVIGTRSAVWSPLPALGLIIIDEEHDASFKQQEGFRYSARDVAMMRAQGANIPIVLGSATPSLESIQNVQRDRYQHCVLSERAGAASPPPIRFIDLRTVKLEEGLSPQLIDQLRLRLERGEQSILFLNRRGFAPVVMCHDCGWIASCQHCDAKMTYHQQYRVMRCHHCGAQRAMMPKCEACSSMDLISVGQGTERISAALETIFPNARVLRIDRDTTRGKDSLTEMLNKIDNGEADILVGTQMLSKGHHFPNVTLVGILDADSRLFATDFRATERLAQLIIQVAGRAGRAELPGEVYIQTHQPDHPILMSLARYDLKGLTKQLLEERQLTNLPPFSNAVMLRADSPVSGEAMGFLQTVRSHIQPSENLEVWGPVVAPMERRAGRYRAQLLLIGSERRELHHQLSQWLAMIDSWKKPPNCRWSVDVDVQDML